MRQGILLLETTWLSHELYVRDDTSPINLVVLYGIIDVICYDVFDMSGDATDCGWRSKHGLSTDQTRIWGNQAIHTTLPVVSS
jgi:hypothetical protein